MQNENKMLKISVPAEFIIELSYVINVLLKEQLNFYQFDIVTSNDEDVIFENNIGKIKFANVFFHGNTTNLHTKENLPSQCIDFSYNNVGYKSLYHRDSKIEKEGNCIYLGHDVFASTYFLLTQWESKLLSGDHLGRYKLATSTIYKFGLYETPVVNQYVQLIQQLLQQLNVETKTDGYKPHFSCDIDSITKYKTFRNLIGSIYHTRKPLNAIKLYLSAKRNKKNDPYYCFDYLFSMLEKYNLEATFYFMAGLEDKRYDTKDYDLNEPLVQEIVKGIKTRQYQIGLHPTINTWQSYDTIKDQKEVLEKAVDSKVVNVRQHYLRYDVGTWAIMEGNDFLYDSSMQFTEGIGFAAGICTPFTLFDLINRRPTKVKEIPLIAMKKKDYVQHVSQSFEKMFTIINEAKKYNGRFMILFHNSDLETENERMLFEKILESL